jgi:hypothetical protein
MYEQSLPPTAEAPEIAASWAREAALALLPEVADDAEKVARDLVAQAIPRTWAGEQIHTTISLGETGLRIEVRDPNRTATRTGVEIRDISMVTRSLWTEAGPEGHLAGAELRPHAGVTA